MLPGSVPSVGLALPTTMEDDIAAALEQMLRGGGGPDLEAFVSRCPESMMPFSREGMAAASEEETVRFEAHALDVVKR